MKRGATLLAAAAAVALTACAANSIADPTRPDAIDLSVKAVPLSNIDPKETRVGHLVFRGGLQITSSDKRFGGWSGLKVSADGTHLLSQSDESHLLRADIAYGKNGDLSGLSHGQLADLQDLDGKVMTGKEGDAEGLTPLTAKGIDGPVAISFERNNRIWEYDITGSLDVKPTPVTIPDAFKPQVDKLQFNLGMESLVLFRPDTLLAIAETPQDANGDHPAWLIPTPGAQGTDIGALGVKFHTPYEISDAALSPDGKALYLLERHFDFKLGAVFIAVRRIDASDVKPGARLDGEEIAALTVHENIDNMEGLALRRGPHGETLLYMIADDNYNALERTLLLMFELQ